MGATAGLKTLTKRQSSDGASWFSAATCLPGQEGREMLSAVQDQVQPPNDPQTPQPQASGMYPCSPHQLPQGLDVCGLASESWRQRAPAATAGRTPDHGACGCGGFSLSGPTGGAAKGTPKNPKMPPCSSPATVPADVLTCGCGCAVTVQSASTRLASERHRGQGTIELRCKFVAAAEGGN